MEVLEMIEKLVDYYQYNKLSPENARLYVQILGSFTPSALEYAFNKHIAQCAFFPKISELAGLAQAYVDYVPPKVESWYARLEGLKEKFWCEGRFDPLEWENLAFQAEQAGLEGRSAHIRETLKRYTAIWESQLAAEDEEE